MSQATNPLVAGFVGGVVSTTLLLPLDVIKVRLQVNEAGGQQARMSTSRLVKGIIRIEGVSGLFQGWAPAVIGSSVSWGGYFYFYEGFKRQLVEFKLGTKSGDTKYDPAAVLTSIDNFVLACCAGGLMVLVTNPIWLIKTRMQLQMKKASETHNIRPYTGIVDAGRTIVRDEGFWALYRGCGPALLLTSHGGVQFVVYEFLRKHFHYHRLERNKDGRWSSLSLWGRLELSSGYLMMGATAKIVASCATYPLQVIKTRMQQRSDAVELTADGNTKIVQRSYQSMMDTTKKIWVREGPHGFFKGVIPNAVRVAPQAAITFLCYEAVMDWFTRGSS